MLDTDMSSSKVGIGRYLLIEPNGSISFAISIQRHPIIRVIRGYLVLGNFLVNLSLVLVGGLIDLVADSVDGSIGTVLCVRCCSVRL